MARGLETARDMLRSLIKRSNDALTGQDEFEIEQATSELSKFIRDEQP